MKDINPMHPEKKSCPIDTLLLKHLKDQPRYMPKGVYTPRKLYKFQEPSKIVKKEEKRDHVTLLCHLAVLVIGDNSATREAGDSAKENSLSS